MSSRATGQSEVQVNSRTVDDQKEISITSLANGGWVVTWDSFADNHGNDWGIYQQLFAASGAMLGTEQRVNTTTTDWQLESTSCALADGGWVVAWKSNLQDGSGYGTYFQRFDSTGAKVGVETLINTTTAGGQVAPHLAALADGGWIAAWDSLQDPDASVGAFLQRFDADGNAVGTETEINVNTTNNQNVDDIVALADGGWVIVWESFLQDGSSTGVYQTRYNASGTAITGDLLVNTYTTSDQSDAAAVALDDGGWVVTWNSNGQDGDSFGIYQQRYDRDGAAMGPETQVHTTITGVQANSSVASLRDGGWVVAWKSEHVDADATGIVQQRFDADGHKVGTETVVNVTFADIQQNPVVTALGNGGWIVAWESYGQDGDKLGVYQRVFMPDVEGTSKSDTLVGTRWNETIIGHSGNDALKGGGGDDVMVGGYGNDTYYVNSVGDQVQETAATQGHDLVRSSISYSLFSNVFLEDLRLTGGQDITGRGNAGDNLIVGNKGQNSLEGRSGNDQLRGGKGVDAFVFKTGWDHDTVLDFHATGSDNDLIDLSGLGSVTGWNDLKNHHLTQVGKDIVIDGLNGDILTLNHVKLADLDKTDFIFH
ncbi:MAG: hypothetical protein KDJ19_11020 [Hyphomicrobiaceae bacterium]|nr:hypothetical protein [Hyphomicrobiaceae bacterium]MCC0024228.1 hypothetical protein [Hyphomicrobiaceae bacterium]